MFHRILVVCVGNICRSPMAEVLLADALGDTGRVSSAGIGALVGEPADAQAAMLMQERGHSLASHRGRQMSEALLREHDLVLVMERAHQAWMETRWPQARGRVFRWGHWLDIDVPDPYGKGEAAFRESLALIERGLATWKEKL